MPHDGRHECYPPVRRRSKPDARRARLLSADPREGNLVVPDVREELRRFDKLVNRCRRRELTEEEFEFYSTLLETEP